MIKGFHKATVPIDEMQHTADVVICQNCRPVCHVFKQQRARWHVLEDEHHPLQERLVRAANDLPHLAMGDPEISFTDALMSAFAMFSLKAPSLLANPAMTSFTPVHH